MYKSAWQQAKQIEMQMTMMKAEENPPNLTSCSSHFPIFPPPLGRLYKIKKCSKLAVNRSPCAPSRSAGISPSLSISLSLSLRSSQLCFVARQDAAGSPFLPPLCRLFTVSFVSCGNGIHEVAEQNKMVENVKCGSDAGSEKQRLAAKQLLATAKNKAKPSE